MSAKKMNPGKTRKQLKAMRAALAASPPLGATEVAVRGKVYPMPEVVTRLSGYEAVYDTAADAETARATAVEEREKIEDETVEFVNGLSDALKGMLGAKSTALINYGVTPEKERAPLTTEQMSAKVAKARATRAARHTMGKNQKKAIKGEIPAPKTP